MSNSLDELLAELEFLKLYVDFQSSSYRNQSVIERSNPNSIFKKLPISKIKQFDFNSHIISLYGIFENYIEQLQTDYLKLISTKITEFKCLPIDIQNNNLNKCIDILKQLEHSKHKNVKKEVLIEILHKNYNENNSLINIEAFRNHTSNFRIATINSYFAEIGIKNFSTLVRQYNPFNEYLSATYSDYSNKKDTIVFQALEHICEIRNNIAHGVKSVQLFNKSILFDYIDFIAMFSTSLFGLVMDNYYNQIFDKLKHTIIPINIFNNKILCFNSNGSVINNSTRILANSKETYPKYVELSISEIQHNNSKIESTNNLPLDIGVCVDKKIKNTMKFKLLE